MLTEFIELARRLECSTHEEDPPRTTERSAAVALTLRNLAPASDQGPEVLLMRRAERASDHWSGQISFPGGRSEPRDRNLVETAIREAWEEVGVRLERCSQLIGRLELVQARARGRIVPMSITPFVFIQTEEMHITLGPEADEAFWFPLHPAHSGEFDHAFEFKDEEGIVHRLPSWNFEERIIWGLTHQMLRTLQALLFQSA